MRKRALITLFLAAISIGLVASSALAGGWEDVWRNLSSGKTITPGVEQTATAYNATAHFTVQSNDGTANNFSSSDKIRGKLEGNGVTLKTPGYDTGQYVTKAELVDWATTNNSSLLKVFFGASPETSFGGTTNASYNSQQLFTGVALSSSSSGGKLPFVPVGTKDVVIKGQYDFMEIGPNKIKATGSSGMLSYERKFGENAGNSIGIGIPYRQIEVKDELNSEYKYASFLPFYKHRWYSDKSMIEAMVNLTLDAVYMKSSFFPDGGGYLEYGGGAGVKYAYAVSSSVDLSAGLSYQLLQKNIPGGIVPDELKWVENAINSLPMEQDIIPSIGIVYRIVPDKLTFRGDIFRITQLQSGVDSGQRNQTVALGLFTYKVGQLAEITLGYKRSFEVKDLTDQSVIASVKFGWK
jgi:hypothetical protein